MFIVCRFRHQPITKKYLSTRIQQWGEESGHSMCMLDQVLQMIQIVGMDEAKVKPNRRGVGGEAAIVSHLLCASGSFCFRCQTTDAPAQSNRTRYVFALLLGRRFTSRSRVMLCLYCFLSPQACLKLSSTGLLCFQSLPETRARQTLGRSCGMGTVSCYGFWFGRTAHACT